MTDEDMDEFTDAVSYGDELTFIYNGQKYVLRGYKQNGKARLYLDRLDPPAEDYILVLAGTAHEFPVRDFLEVKIWNGRSFIEAHEEMEWLDE